MLYDVSFPGDWGRMPVSDPAQPLTETITMPDNCRIFLRGWRAESPNVLLLMHGLGAHSGWFIDMGNELAARGLTVYALDHRGFGRSEGLPGHIDRFNTYVDDLMVVMETLRKRHAPEGSSTRFYVLGHSMGGIFATHLAARHSNLLDGVLFLNPWVADSAQVSPGMLLGVLGGGLVHSKRHWRSPGGVENMTANVEAIKMLEADPYWRRDLTSTFLLQILRMRLQVLKLAGSITLPALVMQAEHDKSVVPAASRKLYEALTGGDKTWKQYADYAHDSEFETNRAQLDQDIVEWIQERARPR